jgi:hypothetical protein
MIFSDGTHDFRISFYYTTEMGQRVTECKIERVETKKKFKENGIIIGQGIAACDSRDRFCELPKAKALGLPTSLMTSCKMFENIQTLL